jgi:hypothetical protein
MDGYIKIDAVEENLREQAREEVEYARNAITAYAKSVGRRLVSEHDRDAYMGGMSYWQATASIATLTAMCRRLGYERLEKILERHSKRLEREFKALYDVNHAQIMAARKAASEARFKSAMSSTY